MPSSGNEYGLLLDALFNNTGSAAFGVTSTSVLLFNTFIILLVVGVCLFNNVLLDFCMGLGLIITYSLMTNSPFGISTLPFGLFLSICGLLLARNLLDLMG